MENTHRLYHTLIQVLSQHRNWMDVRHLKTLSWMMVGLILTGKINLTEWAPYVHSRAQYAESTVRRFRRWLDNKRIKVHRLYAPLVQKALSEWGWLTDKTQSQTYDGGKVSNSTLESRQDLQSVLFS